jgi:hypothetical protein
MRELTPKASKLLRWLQDNAKGEENAKTQDELKSLLGVDNRECRKLTDEILSQGYRVCASNAGVFTPKTDDEFYLYALRIYNMGTATMKRYGYIKKMLKSQEIEKIEFQETMF